MSGSYEIVFNGGTLTSGMTRTLPLYPSLPQPLLQPLNPVVQVPAPPDVDGGDEDPLTWLRRRVSETIAEVDWPVAA